MCPAARFRPGRRTQESLDEQSRRRGLFPQCLQGLAFLHRLVLGDPSGVCRRLAPVAFAWCVCCCKLTGLDRFVAASYGAQQQVNRQVEEAIVAYRREEMHASGQGHARQSDHLGQG